MSDKWASDPAFFEEYGAYSPEDLSFMGEITIFRLWNECLYPTFNDAISSCSIAMACCIAFKMLCCQGVTFMSHLKDVASSILGLLLLFLFFGRFTVYIILLSLLGYFTLWMTDKLFKGFRGICCSIVCVSFLVICELVTVDPEQWHMIRGSQMILTMKLISLAFDMDKSKLALPNFQKSFGYLFFVGDVIFGPWISFTKYDNLKLNLWSKQWVVNILANLLLALVFLSISSCWSYWFIMGTESKVLTTYTNALSFRSSNYFIGFISSALVLTTGVVDSEDVMNVKVSSPYHVELPRSLVEVVTYWNIPMHHWLKTYVFKSAKYFGKIPAIVLTYMASSILHGLNFQLTAVLISLSFYTYIEFELRKKLANLCDMCILSRDCNTCTHHYKVDTLFVKLINSFFSLLAMFHLAYLGVMFEASSTIQEQGYSMEHTLSIWSDLGYISHWVALHMLFIAKVL